jgi:hypothetical protein
MRNFIIVCLSICLLLPGCDTKPDTCREQSAWQLGLGFYNVTFSGTYKSVKKVTLKSFLAKCTILSDTYTFKNDSLPLLQSRDTTVYSITINGKSTANLYVVYKRDKIFENYKCGFRTNFQLDTLYTNPEICDSISIVQPNITDVYQENCRFYFNSDTVKSK